MVPLLGLSAVAAGFFLTRRFRPLSPGAGLTARVVAAAPLVASGMVHLLRPGIFASILPPPLPQSAALIVITGIPELLGALGLFVPATRRTASVALVAYMVAIFPANIYAAGQTIHGLHMPGVPVRWTMQAGYILLLLVAGWGLPRVRDANLEARGR